MNAPGGQQRWGHLLEDCKCRLVGLRLAATARTLQHATQLWPGALLMKLGSEAPDGVEHVENGLRWGQKWVVVVEEE